MHCFPFCAFKTSQMHHRSPTNSKHKQNPSDALEQGSYLDQDVKVEREYLSKLRFQRERIQKLYSNYQQSLSTINSLNEQNNGLKEQLDHLKSRLTVETLFKQLQCKYQVLETAERELREENDELKARYEQLTVENSRRFKQLKAHYTQELQETSLENNMLKEASRNLEVRLEQVRIEFNNLKAQINASKSTAERFRKELAQVSAKAKDQRTEFQSMLSERDQQIAKLRTDVSSLKNQNLEQCYFVQLETEKNEEIIGNYSQEISQLKTQIQKLQSQLLMQLQENNACMTNQEQSSQYVREVEAKYQSLCLQLDRLKHSQADAKQRADFLHKQQCRKMADKIQLLQVQVNTSNKDFALLASKCERLQQMLRKKEMKESARRQLTNYQHQEIDKMDMILRL